MDRRTVEPSIKSTSRARRWCSKWKARSRLRRRRIRFGCGCLVPSHPCAWVWKCSGSFNTSTTFGGHTKALGTTPVEDGFRWSTGEPDFRSNTGRDRFARCARRDHVHCRNNRLPCQSKGFSFCVAVYAVGARSPAAQTEVWDAAVLRRGSLAFGLDQTFSQSVAHECR